jgi:hypothetical protein
MNEETLKWLELERRKQNGTLEFWKVKFLTEGFYVEIRGGEETKSDPPSYLENFADFKKIEVHLYNRGDEPDKKDTKWDPLEVAGMTINFNVHIFPHTNINPKEDDRFKNQSWSDRFEWWSSSGSGPYASLTLDELEEVMNYLVKMDNLAAFV